MALAHSPKIVTDGLVFAYDMTNTQKSWKGAPTTNLISSPRNLADGRNALASSGSSFTDFTTGGPTDGPFVRVTRVNASPPADWPWQISYPTIAIGTSFKFSCYARSTNGSVSTIEFGNPDIEEVSFPLTTQWQRFSTTFTSGVQSNLQFMRINRSNPNDKTIGSIYDVADGQIEVQSILTPFVNGTRSNTQAVVDLMGNNTVTANNLTYASDNTFSFNGTTSSLTIPFNASKFTFNAEQTIIIWMKNQSPSSGRRNPYDQAYAGGGTITHESDTGFNYYFGTGGSNNSPYVGFTSSFSVVVGETAMICLTRNASTVSWYKNGLFSTSIANPYGGSVVTGTNNITLGSGYAGFFGGILYNVQLYNKALTAAEVQQNFNALRTRYGV